MLKKKLLLAFILINIMFAVSGTGAYGENDVSDINGKIEKTEEKAINSREPSSVNPSQKTLSLEDALKIALENNYELKKAAYDRDKADIEAEQTHKSADKINERRGLNLSQAQAKYISEKQKVEANKIAESNYNVALEKIKLTVQSAYHSVLQARELVEVNEAALERAQKQLETAEVNFNVGTVAKVDVLAAQVGVASAKAQLISSRNNYEVAEINLKRIIGLDMDYKLDLTTKIVYVPFAVENLSSSINSAFETRLDVLSAQSNLEVAKEIYRVTVAYTAPNTYVSRVAKIELEKAELAYEDAKKQVVSDLTQAYLNILAAQEVLNSYNAAVDQAREQSRLVNLRYQVGMATSTEVLDASVKLADIQSKQIQALYSFTLAKLSYETAKKAPFTGSTVATSTASSSASASSSGNAR